MVARRCCTGEARGDVGGHPVAAALLDTIARYDLPAQPPARPDRGAHLRSLRRPDADPRRSRGLLRRDLVGADPARQPSSWPRGAIPAARTAAGHAGVAYALTGLLRALPWHAARGQVFLPADVLARHGVTPRRRRCPGATAPALRAALARAARAGARASRRDRGPRSRSVDAGARAGLPAGRAGRALSRRAWSGRTTTRSATRGGAAATGAGIWRALARSARPAERGLHAPLLGRDLRRVAASHASRSRLAPGRSAPACGRRALAGPRSRLPSCAVRRRPRAAGTGRN